MKKPMFLMLALVVVGALVLAACGGGSAPADGSSAAPAVPADYAGKTNPKASDPAAAEAGKEVYTTNCAACHGDTGKGDGPSAAALDPKPKPLAELMSGLKDDYVYWRISEGGAMSPFNSAMPAWKGVITEDQIWQTVAYLRTLQP